MVETLTKPRQRLNHEHPAAWRNVYWLAVPIHLRESPSHPAGVYGPGLFKSSRQHPTREHAECRAHSSLRALSAAEAPYVLYLGAEMVCD